MTQQKATKNRRRKEGYVHRSNAINMTVYNPSGAPISDEVAAKLLNHIGQVAQDNGYFINFTRT